MVVGIRAGCLELLISSTRRSIEKDVPSWRQSGIRSKRVNIMQTAMSEGKRACFILTRIFEAWVDRGWNKGFKLRRL